MGRYLFYSRVEAINMLNEDFFDSKDKTIILLKRKIEDFKKYDAERKQYYANSLQELGALKSYVEELEDVISRESSTIYGKYMKLKQEVKHLNKVIHTKDIQIPNDIEMEYKCLKDKEVMQSKQIKKLVCDNKALRNTIKELIARINKLKNEK